MASDLGDAEDMVTKRKLPRPMPFPLRLDPPLRKRLDELAAADQRSLTNYLMKIITDHVAAHTKEVAMTPTR